MGRAQSTASLSRGVSFLCAPALAMTFSGKAIGSAPSAPSCAPRVWFAVRRASRRRVGRPGVPIAFGSAVALALVWRGGVVRPAGGRPGPPLFVPLRLFPKKSRGSLPTAGSPDPISAPRLPGTTFPAGERLPYGSRRCAGALFPRLGNLPMKGLFGITLPASAAGGEKGPGTPHGGLQVVFFASHPF